MNPFQRVLTCVGMTVPLAVSPAAATTFLAGPMPPVLTVADSPYIVLADLTLPNTSCTIEAGVEINFTTGTSLRMSGTSTLTAAGTSGTPIVIRGQEGAEWNGIVQVSGEPTVELDWCEIADARIAIDFGFGDGGFVLDVEDCTISGQGVNSNYRGIWAGDDESTVSTITIRATTVTGPYYGIFLNARAEDQVYVEDCVASSCAAYGFYVATPGASLVSCVATGNGTGMRFIGGTESDPVQADLSAATDNLQVGMAANGFVRFNDGALHGNGDYDVRTDSPVTVVVAADFKNNFWGETTTGEMVKEGSFSDIEAIFDWWDDSTKTIVEYDGFTAPVSVESSVEISSWGGIKGLYRE